MKLNPNLGSIDKVTRLLLALLLIVLFYTDVVSGTLGIVALISALLLTVTTLIGFCPLYKLFNLSTVFNKKKSIKS